MLRKTALLMLLTMFLVPCAWAGESADVPTVSQDAQPDEMTQKAAELEALANELSGREAKLI